MRPVNVRAITTKRIVLEICDCGKVRLFDGVGFKKYKYGENLYHHPLKSEGELNLLIEKLRDMGVLFSTSKIGGPDWDVECARNNGVVHGKFMRINFYGREFEDDPPYSIEEF